MSGDRTRAMATLEELKKMSPGGEVAPFNLALVYLGLGDRTRALDYLEQAYAASSEFLVWLKIDKIYDPLRSEPRFIALMKRLVVDADLGDVRRVVTRNESEPHALRRHTRHLVDLHPRRHLTRGDLYPLAAQPALEPVARDPAFSVVLPSADRFDEHQRVERSLALEGHLDPATPLPVREIERRAE